MVSPKELAQDMISAVIGDGQYRMLRRRSLCERGYRDHAEEFRKVTGPKNILLGCPDYNNLGDHAIALAECRMLATSDKPLLAFNGSTTRLLKCLKEFVTPEDTVFLQGGGNMGSLYRWEEQYRCDVISLLPETRIVLFPQTISYGDSPASQHFLRHTQQVYARHHDLHLFARETVSFGRMRDSYPDNDVQLTPDIVLSLKGEDSAPFHERNGILLNMRNDVEKVVDDTTLEMLLKAAKATGQSVAFTDTTVSKDLMPISMEAGRQLVEHKFDEFRKARLVITDRLHGMIFSAVTGTPCIALNNSNGKVGFEYQWLKDLPYIHFSQTAEDAAQTIPGMMELTGTRFPADEFRTKYAELIKFI